MPNEQYQSLLALDGPTVRDRFTDGVPADAVAVIADVNDSDLKPLVTDLGGHDLQALLDACGEADRDQDRPTAVSPTPSRAGDCRSPATLAPCACAPVPSTRRPSRPYGRDYGTAMPVVHVAASGAVIPEVPRS